jgi:hypothetical protein
MQTEYANLTQPLAGLKNMHDEYVHVSKPCITNYIDVDEDEDEVEDEVERETSPNSVGDTDVSQDVKMILDEEGTDELEDISLPSLTMIRFKDDPVMDSDDEKIGSSSNDYLDIAKSEHQMQTKIMETEVNKMLWAMMTTRSECTLKTAQITFREAWHHPNPVERGKWHEAIRKEFHDMIRKGVLRQTNPRNVWVNRRPNDTESLFEIKKKEMYLFKIKKKHRNDLLRVRNMKTDEQTNEY